MYAVNPGKVSSLQMKGVINMSPPRPTRYHAISRTLHWLMALLLVGMVSLGYYMKSLTLSPTKFQLYSWHKWTGICLLGVLAFRLIWRLSHPQPARLGSVDRLQAMFAGAGHGLLYLLMALIPLSGWLMSSAKGIPTVLFGLYPLPDLLSKDPELGNRLVTVHTWLNYALIALVFVHVAAALKHHFIDRDAVFSRIALYSKKEK